MRLLLDTHVMLWALYKPSELRFRARSLIAGSGVDLHVSVASIWEAAIKKGKGKLPLAADSLLDDLRAARMNMMVVEPRHAWKVLDFPGPHRDPFDRLILAQALLDDMVLITRDRVLLASTTQAVLA